MHESGRRTQVNDEGEVTNRRWYADSRSISLSTTASYVRQSFRTGRDRMLGREFEDGQVHVEGEPTNKKWYHGRISDRQADSRLLRVAGNVNGAYLVYKRTDGLTLLVHYRRNVHRWKISRRSRDDKYILGRDGRDGAYVKGFDTVSQLIKYHRGIKGVPLILEHGGSVKLSKEYVYNDD